MTTKKPRPRGPAASLDVAAALERERLLWLRKTWPVEAMDDLFRRAARDKGLAAELCKRVAVVAGADDALTTLLKKHLDAMRVNKPRGRKKVKDDEGRLRYYGQLLTFYYMALFNGAKKATARAYAAEMLSSRGVVKTDAAVKNEMTAAHRALSVDQIHPPELREFARKAWPRQ